LKTILYIACILLLSAGCKKYPEDGKRSLKSPLKRIIDHAWKIDKLYIDGADSTDHVYEATYRTPSVQYTFNDVVVNFKKGYYPKDFTLGNYRVATAIPAGITGTQTPAWDFIEDKDRLVFFLDSGPNNANTFQLNAKEQHWDINSLTKDKLDITTIESKRKIRIVFKHP
jgi:hypothetical protein